jgi:hypothetical protein
VVWNIVLPNVHETIKETLSGQRNCRGTTTVKNESFFSDTAVLITIDDAQKLITDTYEVFGIVEDDFEVCLLDATEVVR